MLRERPANALGERLRAGMIAAGHQHRELLAAEPSGHVDSPGLARQQPRDVDEDPVADHVAVLVVDLLEVVDVERGKRDLSSIAPGVGQLACRVLIEPAAIEQVGERVGPCLAPQVLEKQLTPAPENVGDELVDVQADPVRTLTRRVELAQDSGRG